MKVYFCFRILPIIIIVPCFAAWPFRGIRDAGRDLENDMKSLHEALNDAVTGNNIGASMPSMMKTKSPGVLEGGGVKESFQFFSEKFDLRTLEMPLMVIRLLNFFKFILLYKPPVGGSFLYIFNRFLRLRKNRVLGSEKVLDSAQDSEIKKNKYRGKAFELDAFDRNYNEFGSVLPIRSEICLDRIKNVTLPEAKDDSGSSDDDDLILPMITILRDAVLEVLMVSCPPQGSLSLYVERSVKPLSDLQELLERTKSELKSKSGSILSVETKDILDLATRANNIGQVQMLDSLLRVLRDRLLISARRLEQTEKYWMNRINFLMRIESLPLGNMLKQYRMKFFQTSLRDDKRSMAIARAEFEVEVLKLGRVQNILLNRPSDASPKDLLLDERQKNEKKNKSKKGSPNNIQSKSNRSVSTDAVEDSKFDEKSEKWVSDSRALISEIVSSFFSVEGGNNPDVSEDLISLSKWSKGRSNKETWRTGLFLVDSLLEYQVTKADRIYRYIIKKSRKLDLYGVPGSFGIWYIAKRIHEELAPRWDDIVLSAKNLWEVVKGVVLFRFWEPLKDIVLDLLNKRPKLLDPFQLSNEELSLDNMLRDLGVSDGTKEQRDLGIQAASRLYEEELKGGALKGVVRGNMVRLLLVQVQQLKTGLLQAMGSIDHLVDSNRLNVQLLAAIPAFLLLSFGSRVFFTALFRVKSKDLRPKEEVLNEMSEYIIKIERCLLLSNNSDESDLYCEGLGELVLLIHSYLILLEYVCPPTQSKLCNFIQVSMQDLLVIDQSRQLSLLHVVSTTHQKLQSNLNLL